MVIRFSSWVFAEKLFIFMTSNGSHLLSTAHSPVLHLPEGIEDPSELLKFPTCSIEYIQLAILTSEMGSPKTVTLVSFTLMKKIIMLSYFPSPLVSK